MTQRFADCGVERERWEQRNPFQCSHMEWKFKSRSTQKMLSNEEESLRALGRKQLQALAKRRGVRANLKSNTIVEQLLKLSLAAATHHHTDDIRTHVTPNLVHDLETYDAKSPSPTRNAPTLGHQPTPAAHLAAATAAAPPSPRFPMASPLVSRGASMPSAAFFASVHDRVAKIIATSPAMRHKDIRESFGSLSSTLQAAATGSTPKSTKHRGGSFAAGVASPLLLRAPPPTPCERSCSYGAWEGRLQKSIQKPSLIGRPRLL